MQMYIMQKELDIDWLERADDSVQQVANTMRGLREGMNEYSGLSFGTDRCGKSVVERILKDFVGYYEESEKKESLWTVIIDIPKFNDQFSALTFDSVMPAEFSFEAMFVLRDPYSMWHSYVNDHRDTSAHFNREFLNSQMRTHVHQAIRNYCRLGEGILHLQKEDTFTKDLFVPKASQLSHSVYTNVSTFFASDSRLMWPDHSTFSCSWIQQLYRKTEKFFLAQSVFGHLSELYEIAKLYQYRFLNRHLRCRGFSPGSTILTYNFKLPRRFCTLLHHAPKSEMLSPLNPEQELYTSIDHQEDAVIDISMVIFAEFVRMVWYQTAEMYF